jgi:hypothetical protein
MPLSIRQPASRNNLAILGGKGLVLAFFAIGLLTAAMRILEIKKQNPV